MINGNPSSSAHIRTSVLGSPPTPTSIPGGVKRHRKNIARKSTGRQPPRKQYGESFKSNEHGPSEGSSYFSNSSQDAKIASLCSRFADWLDGLGESETDKRILEAVERDGGKFFHLIRCMLDYERALQGLEDHSDMDTKTSGRIGHRTNALRNFAAFLGAKARDSISTPLSLAIDRDGKQLFRLAKCCLSFNNAINGEGSEST
ncbi:hypothetical protein DFJ58DRAFT_728424 [Suillus subalutaceus]|uniref:uncharacterized protein n=1 Tax=Suillus subalutaceus TaxID=48586 RepID=UPI001B87D89B|nr:uncharacterized protein DFJ58DRAFT_728424 [Suillus subalutaceus]KAG1852769.1 hypothetical protein DFJ58DRAFT_728424 [Suillus subalutaceus]